MTPAPTRRLTMSARCDRCDWTVTTGPPSDLTTLLAVDRLAEHHSRTPEHSVTTSVVWSSGDDPGPVAPNRVDSVSE